MLAGVAGRRRLLHGGRRCSRRWGRGDFVGRGAPPRSDSSSWRCARAAERWCLIGSGPPPDLLIGTAERVAVAAMRAETCGGAGGGVGADELIFFDHSTLLTKN